MGNCEKPSPIADQVFILLVQLYRFVTVGDIVFDRLHDQSHHRSLTVRSSGTRRQPETEGS